jgi:hypothetical protein
VFGHHEHMHRELSIVVWVVSTATEAFILHFVHNTSVDAQSQMIHFHRSPSIPTPENQGQFIDQPRWSKKKVTISSFFCRLVKIFGRFFKIPSINTRELGTPRLRAKEVPRELLGQLKILCWEFIEILSHLVNDFFSTDTGRPKGLSGHFNSKSGPSQWL